MIGEYRSVPFRDKGARAVALAFLATYLGLAHPAAGHSHARGSSLEWAPDVAPRLRLLQEHGRAAAQASTPALATPPAKEAGKTEAPGERDGAGPSDQALGSHE